MWTFLTRAKQGLVCAYNYLFLYFRWDRIKSEKWEHLNLFHPISASTSLPPLPTPTPRETTRQGSNVVATGHTQVDSAPTGTPLLGLLTYLYFHGGDESVPREQVTEAKREIDYVGWLPFVFLDLPKCVLHPIIDEEGRLFALLHPHPAHRWCSH